MKNIFVICGLIALLIVCPAYALKETTIYMPAVEETDYGQSGVMATLTINVREGSGHVYVDTWPLAKIDTQASARIARDVSCDTLGIDCSNYDFFYTIRSNSEIVGGPSGGAAMAVATLASLLDLQINNHILITGTINPDGSIGPIGGIVEKAQISSEKGGLFLIPEGQSLVEIDNGSIDAKKYAKENFNLSIVEVRDIKEAFGYFTNYQLKERHLEFTRTESYQNVMEAFGKELISHSKKLQEECIAKAKASKIDYKNREEILALCSQSLDEANDAFSNKAYYSSASLAFSNSISYKYGLKLVGLLESADKKEFTNEYLTFLEKENFEINTSNIELYAIIEERYSEVQDNRELAWKEYYSTNYTHSIYYGSYAEERLYTAVLWNEHSDEFPSYIKTSSEELTAISNEAISDAYSASTYATVIAPNTLSFEAESMIEKAREKQKKGNYYTAIILALKAKANAEVACEISGKEDYAYLVELHRQRALVAINQTNSVIGQSYFEYANTLESTNKVTAIIYYTYAEKLSKISDLINKKPRISKIEPTEFIEPLKSYSSVSPFPSTYILSLVLYWFLV